MATLSPPTLKMKPVPVVTDHELVALLKACAGKEFSDRRDEALIRLLLDCGVRINEACGLRVDDLDLDPGMAIVLGKAQVRPVYFSARGTRLRPLCADAGLHRWAHLDALFLTQRPPIRGWCKGSGEAARPAGRDRGPSPAPFPPHVRPRLPDVRWAGAGRRLAGWSSDVMLERYGASAAGARAKAAAQRLKQGDQESDRLAQQRNLALV